MKIIIEHSKTKRELNGSFNICGSGTDLKKLANQILSEVNEKFIYGWVRICEEQESIANTPPEEWD